MNQTADRKLQILQAIAAIIAEGQAAGLWRTDVEATLLAKAVFGVLDEQDPHGFLLGHGFPETQHRQQQKDRGQAALGRHGRPEGG